MGGTSDMDELFTEKFGSIFKSMFTLFELMSNPDLTPYHGKLERNPGLMIFLIGWIVFGSFGMIALLTGVISESMFEKNQIRVEEERLEREQKRKTLVSHCTNLYDKINLTNEDGATKEELAGLLPEVAEIFDVLAIPYTKHEIENIMDVLDTDVSGFIDKEEWCNGILSIAEGVRPLSIMELFHATSLVRSQVEECS